MTDDKRKMNIICTSCPVGCRLTVFEDKDGSIKVDGNVCVRGKNYATDEFSDPKRMVTSSVRITGGQYPLVSVKTDKPIKKDLVPEVLKIVKSSRVKAPVDIGYVIAQDVKGSGVSVVATRKVDSI
jgi:CxxC motif-containing protein